MWQAFEVASVLTEVTTQLWMATRAATGGTMKFIRKGGITCTHIQLNIHTAAVQSHGIFFHHYFQSSGCTLIVATAVYSPPPTAAHFHAISVLC